MTTPTCLTLLRPGRPGEAGVVRVGDGRAEADYLVRELPCGDWEFRKVNAAAERYVVNPDAGRCTCPGFRWRRRCRHVAAIRRLTGRTRPQDLTPEEYEAWAERAAIRQYLGGMPRQEAEAAALADVLRPVGPAAVPTTSGAESTEKRATGRG